MKTVLSGSILSLALLLPMAANASLITPISYAYTNGTPAGEPGFPNYDDPTFTKLTDGNTGTANGLDGTWVGWLGSDSGRAQITFNFGIPVNITNVALDFLRQDGLNITPPNNVNIAGTNFPTSNFATDNTKAFVNYAGSWNGSTLVVTLNHTTSQWLFVNEAQFTGSLIATPEPASFGLIGLALGALLLGRKRLQTVK